MPEPQKIAIIGTVGVPGKYGGFETLAENLVRHAEAEPVSLTVYCSAKTYKEQPSTYRGADLVYLPLSANGVQSVPYDIWSMLSAIRKRQDRLLILGVSGCLALPLIRLFSRSRILCNIDGIEWRREKWQGLAKWLLRVSEKLAVRFSHVVIADNQAIADYVQETYGRNCEVIVYGGDHALEVAPGDISDLNLPQNYALGLCRIEPENNVEMILEAFAESPGNPLVFVGNWNSSPFGRALRARFSGYPNLHILDPVYEAGRLRAVRDRARLYVHGHSAGGTNPSLVEMMHFGIPVAAFDCNYNRYTTEAKARYFGSAEALARLLEAPGTDGADMAVIAGRRYTWDSVGASYFTLLAGE